MIARRLMPADLEACLATRKARIGQEAIGYERALTGWRSLLGSVALRSVVILAERPIRGHRIVGFGANVFVRTDFAREETTNPRPGLNQRIIASLVSDRPAILTDAQVQQQNTNGGLCMAILFTDWPRAALNGDEVAEVKLELAKAGVERLSGYRLEMMLLEAIDSIDIDYIESTGVYRKVSDFAGTSALPAGSVRALFAIDKKTAQAVPGSVATFLFQYSAPILRFKKCDQQLLSAALEGLTDHELAPHLELKFETVKKRWASIYAQAAEALPHLLPEAEEDEAERHTRGPQKRHHLLAYLRRHPEELRPFVR